MRSPRRLLYSSPEVTGWAAREADDLITTRSAPQVTIYPIETDGENSIAVQWNMSVEAARHLARRLTEACDAIDADAAEQATAVQS